MYCFGRLLFTLALISVSSKTLATEQNIIEIVGEFSSNKNAKKGTFSQITRQSLLDLLYFAGFTVHNNGHYLIDEYYELEKSRWALSKEKLDLLDKAESLAEKRMIRDKPFLANMGVNATNTRENSFKTISQYTVTGFPLEALVFYTAIGASMVQKAYTDSLFYSGRSDPVYLENLLNEIASPVGLFSFFCFVFFSSHTNHLYSKILFDGFTFKKGPLKDLTIRPLMPIDKMGVKLGWDPMAKYKTRTSHRLGIPPSPWEGYVRWIDKSENPKALQRPPSLFKDVYVPHFKFRARKTGIKFVSSYGGPLALSAGLMASNIVTEIDYIFRHDPNFSNCRDKALHSQNAALACEVSGWGEQTGVLKLLFPDIFTGQTAWGSTIRSFAPDLVSMVTASIMSHAITQVMWMAGPGGVIKAGEAIRHPFVKGMAIKSVNRISVQSLQWLMLIPYGGQIRLTGQTVKASLKLGWNFFKKDLLADTTKVLGYHKLRKALTSETAKKWKERAGIGGRAMGWFVNKVFNLYVFFKTEELLTRDFGDMIEDNMKAAEIAYAIENFENIKAPPNTASLICDTNTMAQSSPDCRYHPKISNIVKIFGSFDRWRLHQKKEALTSQINWAEYISSAIMTFEHTHNTYQQFFKPKTPERSFSHKNYLGSTTTVGPGGLNHEQIVMEKIRAMIWEIKKELQNQSPSSSTDEPSFIEKIFAYFLLSDLLEASSPSTEKPSFKYIVSPSPSRFLNPDIDWNKPDEYHLLVLEGLFQAIDPQIPLSHYYENPEEAIAQEKQSLSKDTKQKYKTHIEIIANQHFTSLERIFNTSFNSIMSILAFKLGYKNTTNLSHAQKAYINNTSLIHLIVNFYILVKITRDQLEDRANKWIDKVYNQQGEDLEGKKLLSVGEFSTLVPSPRVVLRLQQHIRAIDRKLEDLKNIAAIVDPNTNWQQMLKSQENTERYLQDLEPDTGNEYIKAVYDRLKLTWEPWLKEKKAAFHMDDSILDTAYNIQAEDNLRKKVLGSGIKYLQGLVAFKKKLHRDIDPHYVALTRQKQRICDLNQCIVSKIPEAAIPVYHRLGPDNIFARLYEKTFVGVRDPFSQNFVFRPIEPQPQGMLEIEVRNWVLQHNFNKHPKKLKRLGTPHITSFTIASMICGPDLSTHENTRKLRIAKAILTSKNPAKNSGQPFMGKTQMKY